jgi:DNA-binding CsgD family transcriptional regulator
VQLESEDRSISFDAFAEEIGVSAFIVADLDHDERAIVGAHSTMSDDWMAHYANSDFSRVDPFLEGAFNGKNFMDVGCGALAKYDAMSDAAYELNHGLKDAGYSRLVGTCFRSANSPLSRFVSLSFQHEDQILDKSAQLAFSGILNSFVDLQSNVGATQFFRSKSPLSTRETDALSFLAEGRNISQIAYCMGISETMVHRHLTSSQNKLGARTREQLIVIAFKKRFIAL